MLRFHNPAEIDTARHVVRHVLFVLNQVGLRCAQLRLNTPASLRLTVDNGFSHRMLRT